MAGKHHFHGFPYMAWSVPVGSNCLWEAVSVLDADGAARALAAGADADSRDGTGMTVMMRLAGMRKAVGGEPVVSREEDMASEDMMSLLAGACDAGAMDTDGRTALMVAVKEGNLGFAEKLLAVSDPEAVDKNGRTALMVAAACGDMGCVSLLLPVSEEHARDFFGWSVMDHAERTMSDALSAMIEAKAMSRSVKGAPVVRGRSV